MNKVASLLIGRKVLSNNKKNSLVRCLLFLIIEGQGWNPFLKGLQCRSDFSPKIASLCFQLLL